MSPIVMKGIFYSTIVATLFFGGFFFDRFEFYLPYKDKQEAIAKVQKEVVNKLNEQIATNEKEANENLINTANSINNYYKLNPVTRVRIVNGTCTMSEAPGNTPSSDATPSLDYASPYSPESTEQVANQLYELQQLLIKDGVTIK